MISAVVLTKNEEKNIRDCLKTLQWCDEVVIIDDYSTDKTIEKVQMFKSSNVQNKLKIKIYKRHLNNDFAAQRNFGLEKAKNKWVLFIDADERISAPLAAEIQYQVSSIKYQGFYLKRQDYFGGRWFKHGETSRAKLLRLAKKGVGKWQRSVHEIWQINGPVGELKNPIYHYPHQTISEFLNHLNFHSGLHAKALEQEGKKASFWRLIVNPLAKFCQNWLLRLGFLDKTPGLIVALMMSFHSFLAWSKFYLSRQNQAG